AGGSDGNSLSGVGGSSPLNSSVGLSRSGVVPGGGLGEVSKSVPPLLGPLDTGGITPSSRPEVGGGAGTGESVGAGSSSRKSAGGSVGSSISGTDGSSAPGSSLGFSSSSGGGGGG